MRCRLPMIWKCRHNIMWSISWAHGGCASRGCARKIVPDHFSTDRLAHWIYLLFSSSLTKKKKKKKRKCVYIYSGGMKEESHLPCCWIRLGRKSQRKKKTFLLSFFLSYFSREIRFSDCFPSVRLERKLPNEAFGNGLINWLATLFAQSPRNTITTFALVPSSPLIFAYGQFAARKWNDFFSSSSLFSTVVIAQSVPLAKVPFFLDERKTTIGALVICRQRPP